MVQYSLSVALSLFDLIGENMSITSDKVPSSTINIKQITAPSPLSPVTLAEQKLFSRINGTLEDTLIQMLIDSATTICEQYIRGGILTRNWEQSEDNFLWSWDNFPFAFRKLFGSEFGFEISNIQVSAIIALKMYDVNDVETIISNTLYRLDRANANQPARIIFKYGSSVGNNTRQFTQYKLEYTAGYANSGAVPAQLKLAIMMTAHNWYENRETIGELVPIAKQILNPYRILEL
jgi:uncharacterized phiE125 gp8 family phage protein